jgi:hypothetical protein
MEDIARIGKIYSYVMEMTGVCLRTMPALSSGDILAKFVPYYAKPLEKVPTS